MRRIRNRIYLWSTDSIPQVGNRENGDQENNEYKGVNLEWFRAEGDLSLDPVSTLLALLSKICNLSKSVSPAIPAGL